MRNRRNNLGVILLMSLSVVLGGCAAATRKVDDPPPPKDEVRIVIENFAYKPAEVTIAPGTRVKWINKDDAPHTATSVDKKFNSGGLDTDDTFSFVFNEKGNYAYFCALHPQMKASVTVK